MNAPPEVQARLLDLQDLDTALDRLAQRRRTLPELADIEKLSQRDSELVHEIAVAETELTDRDRDVRKIELDVDQVRTRMQRDQERLDTGAVSSAKELENLQHELGSLAKRMSDLEDVELEHMELRDEVQRRLTALQSEQTEMRAALAEAERGRDAAFAEMDDESAAQVQARASLATELAGPLLDLYEKLRASSGGQGAARLHRGRCEGCHLTLTPVDLGHIKNAPEDEVLRCEECRRILVRTNAE